MARRKPKGDNSREIRSETRNRYAQFLVTKLTKDPDIETSAIARKFMEDEKDLVARCGHAAVYGWLVRLADEILKGSLAIAAARNSKIQLVLPMSLEGFEMPGAFSFVSGANRVRWVANYKAEKWQLASHRSLRHKFRDEVVSSTSEFDAFYVAIMEEWEHHADCKTLGELLKKLRDKEPGVA